MPHPSEAAGDTGRPISRAIGLGASMTNPDLFGWRVRF
jgi:hypothetical protein